MFSCLDGISLHNFEDHHNWLGVCAAYFQILVVFEGFAVADLCHLCSTEESTACLTEETRLWDQILHTCGNTNAKNNRHLDGVNVLSMLLQHGHKTFKYATNFNQSKGNLEPLQKLSKNRPSDLYSDLCNSCSTKIFINLVKLLIKLMLQT